MWNDISKPWKAAFSNGWTAFKNGSIPIGAVIADENENILSEGRNRIYEEISLNPKVAHAETESIRSLDIKKFPDIKNYTLYTCMEPCPMCMGTIVMSNLRKVIIAAKDSYCGAAGYCETDPYIKSKGINVIFKMGELQLVQLVLQAYFEIKRSNGSINNIVKIFEQDCPTAVQIARVFYEERYLDKCVENNIGFDVIFDKICIIKNS